MGTALIFFFFLQTGQKLVLCTSHMKRNQHLFKSQSIAHCALKLILLSVNGSQLWPSGSNTVSSYSPIQKRDYIKLAQYNSGQNTHLSLSNTYIHAHTHAHKVVRKEQQKTLQFNVIVMYCVFLTQKKIHLGVKRVFTFFLCERKRSG